MPGRIFTELLEIGQDQHGYLRPENLRERGIDPKRLGDLKRRGQAEHVAHGVYRLRAIPRGDLDEYMEAVLWPDGRGVLSHDTALDLHELCDINPARMHVTVPRGYRTHRQVPGLYVIHRRDLTSRDITQLEGVPIVIPLRAILDGVEANVRGDLVEQAIDTAVSRGMITRRDAERAHQAHRTRIGVTA